MNKKPILKAVFWCLFVLLAGLASIFLWCVVELDYTPIPFIIFASLSLITLALCIYIQFGKKLTEAEKAEFKAKREEAKQKRATERQARKEKAKKEKQAEAEMSEGMATSAKYGTAILATIIIGIIVCALLPGNTVQKGITLGFFFAVVITLAVIMLRIISREEQEQKEAEKAAELKREKEKWDALPAEEKRRIKEAERKAKTIVETYIIGQNNEKRSGDAVWNAALGGIIAGGAGAVVGATVTKDKDTITFLIVFEDGHRETDKADYGSPKYNEYIKYLVVK